MTLTRSIGHAWTLYAGLGGGVDVDHIVPLQAREEASSHRRALESLPLRGQQWDYRASG